MRRLADMRIRTTGHARRASWADVFADSRSISLADQAVGHIGDGPGSVEDDVKGRRGLRKGGDECGECEEREGEREVGWELHGFVGWISDGDWVRLGDLNA